MIDRDKFEPYSILETKEGRIQGGRLIKNTVIDGVFYKKGLVSFDQRGKVGIGMIHGNQIINGIEYNDGDLVVVRGKVLAKL